MKGEPANQRIICFAFCFVCSSSSSVPDMLNHNDTSSHKYGLHLRAPPQAKNKFVSLRKPSVFCDDSDNDNDVEDDIARQASKQKTLRDVDQQHKRALEQDPTVFDYDAVYDDLKKKKAARIVTEDAARNKPKYITKLIEKARVREQEHEIIYERKLAKERASEDHLYGDKDKFVTSAYKKKLAEQAKWLEEERLRELCEKAEEVTKRSDLSDFYRNLLSKNVTFGGGAIAAKDNVSSQESSHSEHGLLGQKMKQENCLSGTDSTLHDGNLKPHSLHEKVEREASKNNENGIKDTASERLMEQLQNKTSSAALVLEKPERTTDTSRALQADRKPSEDVLTAAKERYLARKQMRGS